MAEYRICVNGFEICARYSEAEEQTVLSEALNQILSAPKKGARKIVFLAGPPGAGKSTLALVLCEKGRKAGAPMQALGLDGFHLPAKRLMEEYTERNGMLVRKAEIKGAPESFDASGFLDALEAAQMNEHALWPVYDRNLHDVRGEKEEVKGGILLVEGNWLLLNRPVWCRAKEMCDVSIAVHAPETIIRPRLIQRKMRGGKSALQAQDWYEKVDGPNARIYETESAGADLQLVLTENGLVWMKNE